MFFIHFDSSIFPILLFKTNSGNHSQLATYMFMTSASGTCISLYSLYFSLPKRKNLEVKLDVLFRYICLQLLMWRWNHGLRGYLSEIKSWSEEFYVLSPPANLCATSRFPKLRVELWEEGTGLGIFLKSFSHWTHGLHQNARCFLNFSNGWEEAPLASLFFDLSRISLPFHSPRKSIFRPYFDLLCLPVFTGLVSCTFSLVFQALNALYMKMKWTSRGSRRSIRFEIHSAILALQLFKRFAFTTPYISLVSLWRHYRSFCKVFALFIYRFIYRLHMFEGSSRFSSLIS